MTQAIEAFLEANAKRTQGEWRASENKKFGWIDISHNNWCEKGETSTIVRVENYQEEQKENATFIAAASRIAPDLAKMLDDMRVAVETLTQIEHNMTCERYVRECAGQALARLKPYEKLFKKENTHET